jgi:hypothetical protein
MRTICQMLGGKMRSSNLIVIALCALCAASAPAQTQPLIPSFDPLGLGGATQTAADSVDRTMIQLQKLENVTAAHVEQRLEQIRSIIKDATVGTQATIDLATIDMLILEGQVNADAVNLIYRTECAANTILNYQLQKSFANFISTLKKADPALAFAGVRFLNIDMNEVTIDEPNNAYASAKAAALTALNRMDDNSSAYKIVFIYQNLGAAAMYARCHYIDDRAAQIFFTMEANDWERRAAPWIAVARPEVIQ